MSLGGRSSYFEKYPGYYETGDAGYIDENGYVFVMARTDDNANATSYEYDALNRLVLTTINLNCISNPHLLLRPPNDIASVSNTMVCETW